VVYPKRGLFDQSTGFLESYVAGDWYRGSGVVARDPKLIYSCGHLFYDNGVWATDYLFYRAYHDSSYPDPADAAAPRGFRYFTSYSDNANVYGPDSARSFAYDFTVFYGANSFGPAVGWWPDAGAILRSDRPKRIAGYPTRIEYTGEPGQSYQYATDWFNNTASRVNGAYHSFNRVSTGGGTSGGPVFVWDAASSDYHLGGILVSGSTTTAGVYALNEASNSMASAALGIEGVARTFSNDQAVRLPDAGRTVTRSTTASGFSETISGLKFSLSVSTPRRGDLDIYLRSPSGRIRWVNKRSANGNSNIEINQANYTAAFRGLAANGVWQLKMRDVVPRNRAKFHRFSVSITANGG
jgi:hypothetical protein